MDCAHSCPSVLACAAEGALVGVLSVAIVATGQAVTSTTSSVVIASSLSPVFCHSTLLAMDTDTVLI